MLSVRTNIVTLIQITLLIFLSSSFGYQIGVGIYDITGPVTNVNMMGYAEPKQVDNGIHMRLFSRAFVIKENQNSTPVAIVILDSGMVSQAVKTQVVKLLRNHYGDIFNHQNTLISATHTHSGPAGYFQYLLYAFTSLGYVDETFKALTSGIVHSIVKAYNNLQAGKIYFAEGDLLDANINRSPKAYEMNPADERALYEYDVDKKMLLLKFVDLNNQPIGMINWFPVHPVSMNKSNCLVSSDNKGLASIMFEKKINMNKTLGKGPFVAAFAQANEGDVSPNTRGPLCTDTGLPCDPISSTCSGRSQTCIAFGPGSDMFESTKLIGEKQFNTAWLLFEQANIEVTGAVNFVHQFVDMTNISVTYKNDTGTTCKPAMGYSFAAGTTDGPGEFDFTQGTKEGSYFWDFVRDLVRKPSDTLTRCQAPKPILLPTGEINFPYPWQPDIVETQIFRMGQFLIVALPGEFTTMSGRRIRNAVKMAVQNIERDPERQVFVALTGLSNLYSSYIATPEEYALQRYEGASTIYGKLTLPAYEKQYTKLTNALVNAEALNPGPSPPFFVDKLIGFIPIVLFDRAPFGYSYGDVIQQPNSDYNNADETVVAAFVGASPRNNQRINDTFLTVERLNEQINEWDVRFTDADWETKFVWGYKSSIDWLFGTSQVIISWTVKSLYNICEPGIYRIQYFGTAKQLFGQLINFTGTTKNFTVVCK